LAVDFHAVVVGADVPGEFIGHGAIGRGAAGNALAVGQILNPSSDVLRDLAVLPEIPGLRGRSESKCAKRGGGEQEFAVVTSHEYPHGSLANE
jgi:hypothetical protein